MIVPCHLWKIASRVGDAARDGPRTQGTTKAQWRNDGGTYAGLKLDLHVSSKLSVRHRGFAVWWSAVGDGLMEGGGGFRVGVTVGDYAGLGGDNE